MNKIKAFLAKITAFLCKVTHKELKVGLPQTLDAYKAFAEAFIQKYGFDDTNDTRQWVATAVLQLPMDSDKIDPETLAIAMRRGLAQKAAYQAIQELKKVPEAPTTVETTEPVTEAPKS